MPLRCKSSRKLSIEEFKSIQIRIINKRGNKETIGTKGTEEREGLLRQQKGGLGKGGNKIESRKTGRGKEGEVMGHYVQQTSQRAS